MSTDMIRLLVIIGCTTLLILTVSLLSYLISRPFVMLRNTRKKRTKEMKKIRKAQHRLEDEIRILNKRLDNLSGIDSPSYSIDEYPDDDTDSSIYEYGPITIEERLDDEIKELKKESLSRKEFFNELKKFYEREEKAVSDADIEKLIDGLNIDWNENAVERVRRIVAYCNGSYSEIGLMLEKKHLFTREESRYGIDNASVDWVGQAVRKGRSYLSHGAWSKRKLIDQLIYHSFEPSEAEAAVEILEGEGDFKTKKEILMAELKDKDSYSKKSFFDSYVIRNDEEYGTIDDLNDLLNEIGFDWKDNAQKQAFELLKDGPMRKQDLIAKLVDRYGFTNEEAQYAADNPYPYSRHWTID